MVNVTEIGEMGAYVTLLEYDNIEVNELILTDRLGKWMDFIHMSRNICLSCLSQGMILLSELSRRRIRSIKKLCRVNRTEVVMVLRVDKEKGAPLVMH